MKNELSDLNNQLFAELERLGEKDLILDKEKLENESLRARMICGVSMQILASGHLSVKARDLVDGSFCKIKLPELFGEIDVGEPKITHIATQKPLIEKKDA
jgi:hypothetical protein